MFPPKQLRSLVAFIGLAASPAWASVTINQTDNATDIGAYSARVGARVTALGEDATWVIEYGTTTAYGMKSPVTDVDRDTFTHYSFTIEGMKANTVYHYRCRAVGSTTRVVVVGPDRTFTTGPHEDVVVTVGPTAFRRILPLGTSLYLDSTVDSGSYPFTYQWKRNGINRGTASRSDGYSIRNVTAADGGTWSVEVNNPGSRARSPGTLITIVTPVGLNKTVAEGGSFTATVTLSPSNPNATYRWSKDETDLTGIGDVNGGSSSSLTVKNITAQAAGEYYCEVTIGSDSYKMDVGELEVGLKPVMDSISDQTFRVGEQVSIYLGVQNSPATITVSPLPPGLTFSASEGRIKGRPTSATPSVQSKIVSVYGTNAFGRGPTTNFGITVNALVSEVVGTFDGIIQRSGDTKNLGGKIRTTVTSTGAVSGTITLGTVPYSFRSVMETSNTSDEISLYLPSVISGRNPALELRLNVDANGLSGSINSSMGWAGVTGYRNIWSKLNPNAAKGPYNTRFSPQGSELGNLTYPQGHSFAAFTMSDLGVVNVAGRMADGSLVTSSTTLGPAGQMPIFLTIYGGNGSLLGTPSLTGTDIGGDMTWSKNPPAGGRLYGSGFAAQSLQVEGRLYTKPDTLTGQRFLNLGDTSNNVVLSFNGATLSAGLQFPFTVNSTSKPVLTLPHPNALVVTINVTTGLVNGTFKVTDPNPILTGKTVTRTATWFGLVIPTHSKAMGFFTIPDLPASGPPASLTGITANPMQSGSLELAAPPPPSS